MTGEKTDESLDSQRERFRQALEAKKSKSHRGNQGPTSASVTNKDASNRAGAKREHRRKSG